MLDRAEDRVEGWSLSVPKIPPGIEERLTPAETRLIASFVKPVAATPRPEEAEKGGMVGVDACLKNESAPVTRYSAVAVNRQR